MKCNNCGAENQSGSFCMSCGSPLTYQTNEPIIQKPPISTMVLAIISYATFFYLGLPATLLMIFSRDAFYTGDMDKFTRYNKYSRICSIIGICIISAILVLYIGFLVFCVIGGIATS